MPRETLRFSIVTPTLDRLAMLQEAVASVRIQRYPNVEHIIVDGGSTDGTVDWVRAQADLVLVPPPDAGVYDAMNKGIAAATGEIVGLLNSDDLYEVGAFAAVAATFVQHPAADVVAGWSRLIEAGEVVAEYATDSDVVPTARDALIGRCLPNPRFYRRGVLERIGPIDTSLGLVADRDLIVRLIVSEALTVALKMPVYLYRRHEGSLTFDVNLKLSLRLRQELVRLGHKWRHAVQANPAVRAAGCELEGRQRLMLALVALRAGKPGSAAKQLFIEEGKGSSKPSRAVAYAALAALRSGVR